MNIQANWNGKQMPLAEVQVPVLDRAFMFGDAVYEVIRVYGGRAWRLTDHINRLQAGLSEIEIQFDTRLVVERLSELLKSPDVKESLAYIQVTRGCAPRHHHYPDKSSPNCLIYVEPFSDPYQTARKDGASAITFRDIRWKRNDIKATTLLANCMAADAAHKQGCIESILLQDDTITEGSHTSVFGVAKGKVIVSPSSASVLPGITKKQVIELCRSASIEMKEGYLKLSALNELEELFITATPEEIIGITRLDGKVIGDGHTGKITRRLQEEFRKTVSQWLGQTV